VDQCEGIEFCPLSKNRYVEDFQLKQDPRGREYYWLGGKKSEEDLTLNTDDYVVDRNKIAIVPVRFEFNSAVLLDDFKSWKIS
ncbi:MAG: hypothetical protein KDD94_11330, partial [Calditrichaeota bacterium]|nr:hypothetical protein [Calditrichota bacterium]